MTAPAYRDAGTEAHTEAFLARVQHLSSQDWDGIMNRALALGEDLIQDDVIRGAVVAITVRSVLPAQHFAILYMPFADAIPFASLVPGEPNRG